MVVITGASSGIGRATALAFARRGSSLVLAARRADALESLVQECQQIGVRAIAVPTDVADADAVEALASTAEDRFGRIDIWINNASVYLAGRFEDMPPEDFRRLVEVNFFGCVNGARAVLPASIDTPLFHHASNYTGWRMKAQSPVYSPEMVADAMIRCAERGTREVIVGRAGRFMAASFFLTPRIAERLFSAQTNREHFLKEERCRRPPATCSSLKPTMPGSTAAGAARAVPTC